MKSLLLLLVAWPLHAAQHEVKISGAAFEPKELTLKKGDTVVWKNDDPVPHTVIGDGFKSKALENGGTFKYKVKKTGTLEYHCDLHVDMKAKLVVE